MKLSFSKLTQVLFWAECIMVGISTPVTEQHHDLDLGNVHRNSSQQELNDIGHFTGSSVKQNRVKRVVQGREITPGSWPWLAAFGKTTPEGFKYIHCGATLYDNKHIITAQHCLLEFNRQQRNFQELSANVFHVVLGDHNIKTREGPEQERRVSHIIHHSGFNKDQAFRDDLSVLELSDSVKLMKDSVWTIPLNTDHSCPQAGQTCFVAGWGKTAEDAKRSNVPLEAAVTIISNEQCAEMYGHSVIREKLCAGNGAADSCTGDSGGPLVCTCGGRKVLAGIVSYGRFCGRPSRPGVYTRVSKYVNWIKDAAVFTFP